MKKLFLFLFMLFTVSISYAVVKTSCKEKKNLEQFSVNTLPVVQVVVSFEFLEPEVFRWQSQESYTVHKILFKEKLNKASIKVTKAERQNLARNVTV